MISTGLHCFIVVLHYAVYASTSKKLQLQCLHCLLMTCRTAGEVFSVSLAQGGPAPCFFRNWCYQFLTTGDFDALQLTKDDVDDLEYALLIERVSTSAMNSRAKALKAFLNVQYFIAILLMRLL